MEIFFSTKRQRDIAELMWAAEQLSEAQEIMTKYGHDGRVVYNMIIASAIDEDVMKSSEFPQADEVIGRFTL